MKRLVFVLIAALSCEHALAAPHELSMNFLGGAEYEVQISYDANACYELVNPPDSVEVLGNEINISSPQLGPQNCVGPLPPQIEYETANVGTLVPGRYTVTWTQDGSFSVQEEFFINGPDIFKAVNPIPVNSIWLILGLSLALLTFGLFHSRNRSMR